MALVGEKQRPAAPERLRLAKPQRDVGEREKTRIAGDREVSAPGDHVLLATEGGLFRDP